MEPARTWGDLAVEALAGRRDPARRAMRFAVAALGREGGPGAPGDESLGLPSGWRERLDLLWPNAVRAGSAPHHIEFWSWVQGLRLGQPAPPWVAVWPRGGAKSTSAELAVGRSGHSRRAPLMRSTCARRRPRPTAMCKTLARCWRRRAVRVPGRKHWGGQSWDGILFWWSANAWAWGGSAVHVGALRPRAGRRRVQPCRRRRGAQAPVEANARDGHGAAPLPGVSVGCRGRRGRPAPTTTRLEIAPAGASLARNGEGGGRGDEAMVVGGHFLGRLRGGVPVVKHCHCRRPG